MNVIILIIMVLNVFGMELSALHTLAIKYKMLSAMTIALLTIKIVKLN